jgi:hypothetical protein
VEEGGRSTDGRPKGPSTSLMRWADQVGFREASKEVIAAPVPRREAIRRGGLAIIGKEARFHA